MSAATVITTRAHNGCGSVLPALAAAALLCASCGGSADGPTTITGTSAAEVEFLSFELVNSARRDNGVEPQLVLEELISAVARAHSEAMRDQGFFGHNGPDGTLEDRLRRAGLAFSRASENVAQNSSAADPAGMAHSGFMASDGHRAAILDPRFRLVGVGVASNGDSYWLTQIFIRR